MLKKFVIFSLIGMLVAVSCTRSSKSCKKAHKNKKKLNLAPGFK